jgi:hypothetical protein
MTEALKMSDTALTLDKVLEDSGLTAKWEARGEKRGEEKKALEMAQYLMNKGWTLEQVIDATKLDAAKGSSLYTQSP